MGTPRTHRRFLNRVDGSYGPIPARRPLGMLSMPFNRTAVQGLYCVGDSTFPGQGVNAGGCPRCCACKGPVRGRHASSACRACCARRAHDTAQPGLSACRQRCLLYHLTCHTVLSLQGGPGFWPNKAITLCRPSACCSGLQRLWLRAPRAVRPRKAGACSAWLSPRARRAEERRLCSAAQYRVLRSPGVHV